MTISHDQQTTDELSRLYNLNAADFLAATGTNRFRNNLIKFQTTLHFKYAKMWLQHTETRELKGLNQLNLGPHRDNTGAELCKKAKEVKLSPSHSFERDK